jgi:protein-L-isoaspartate(D-aspartate) O-methyltransferase
MEDSYRHKGLRRQLIADLRVKGITDEQVLAAMEELPRHFFLDKTFEEWAYQDKAFPIGNNQTISQPHTVAFMSALLNVEKRMKVLEVGTGSGYQAAVLAKLGARVYTVERHKELQQTAKRVLENIGLGLVRTFYRDGYKGLAEYAPFDRIIVTAGAPTVPDALRQQLAIGGIMVIPVGETEQQMFRIQRISVEEFQEEVIGSFKFVPFVEGMN